MSVRAAINTSTNPMPILAVTVAVLTTVALFTFDVSIPHSVQAAEPSVGTLVAAGRAGAIVLQPDPIIVGSPKK